MNVSIPSIIWPTWTRSKTGENFYDITSHDEWATGQSNLTIAQNHPILTPAILFIAKIFSQAEFSVKRNSTAREFKNHGLLKLLDDPNPYQTRQDFLETLMFMQIAQGVAVVYGKRVTGFSEPEQMFILDYDLIVWPEEIKKGKNTKLHNSKNILNKYVIYDPKGEHLKIQIKDLMFFYDLPNCVDRNPFKVKSRLDGLGQTLINTQDSLIAKNIILKSNGKELITGKKDGFPLADDEKKEINRLWNTGFGLGFNRKRGVITKADVTWKSLHIALRDLGLDESVKVDGNLIYTALHIPKDILSLEAKKTTYNNFKESMVSYIQNEMQSSLNSFTATLNKLVKDNYKLTGSYEHMPIMQFILIERYDGIKKRGEALSSLRSAGLPDEVALELCGFETTLQLNELTPVNNGQQEQQNSRQEENEEED